MFPVLRLTPKTRRLTRLDVSVQNVVGMALRKSPQDSPHVTGNLHACMLRHQSNPLQLPSPCMQRKVSLKVEGNF